jgi:hypothetical protein
MNELKITGYFHCKNCSALEQRQVLAVGFTKEGHVQVWCEACDKEVIYLRPPKPKPEPYGRS